MDPGTAFVGVDTAFHICNGDTLLKSLGPFLAVFINGKFQPF